MFKIATFFSLKLEKALKKKKFRGTRAPLEDVLDNYE